MLLAALALALAAPEPTVVEGVASPEDRGAVPSRLRRGTAPVERTDRFAAHILHDFADCLVRNRPALATALLETELQSPAQAAVLARLVPSHSNCLRARHMRVDNALLRGAIAEALLRRRKSPRAIEPPTLAEEDRLGRWSRCAVAAHADQVERTLATPPGSRAELDSLTALEAAAAECRSARLELREPLRLRGALGEAYYLAGRRRL